MKRRAFVRSLVATGIASMWDTRPGPLLRPATDARAQQQPSPATSAIALPTWIASVGDAEVLLAKADRDRLGLPIWPDGNIGVLHSGSSYTFIAASHGKVARTVGTLANPAAGSIEPEIAIQNMKHAYEYAGGGPIYQDPASTAAVPMLPFDVGGGTFLVIGDSFYVYFRDQFDDGHANNLSIARASVTDVVDAAVNRGDVAYDSALGVYLASGDNPKQSAGSFYLHPPTGERFPSRGGLLGTAGQILETVGIYRRAGIDTFHLQFPPEDTAAQIQQFGRELLPKARALA